MMLCVAKRIPDANEPQRQLVTSAMRRRGINKTRLAMMLTEDKPKYPTSPQAVGQWLATGGTSPRHFTWAEIVKIIESDPLSRDDSGFYGLPSPNKRTIALFPERSNGTALVVLTSTTTTIDDWGTDAERYGVPIATEALSPELIPGDVIYFEVREPEPGNIVNITNGPDNNKVRIMRGHGVHARFESLTDDQPALLPPEWTVKGVAVGFKRRGRNGSWTYEPDGVLRLPIER